MNKLVAAEQRAEQEKERAERTEVRLKEEKKRVKQEKERAERTEIRLKEEKELVKQEKERAEQEKITIVKNLLTKGMDDAFIAQITGFSLQTIQKIREIYLS